MSIFLIQVLIVDLILRIRYLKHLNAFSLEIMLLNKCCMGNNCSCKGAFMFTTFSSLV